MRKYKRFALIIALLMVFSTAAFAADETEIEESTSLGMTWLAENQNSDGSWGSYEHVAQTGLAVLKFETHAINMGIDPFDEGYEYSEMILKGLNYIFNQTFAPACDGLVATTTDHQTYNTSIALMALAASKSPDHVIPDASPLPDGMTYLEVAQAYTDFLIDTQIKETVYEGGWGYGCGDPSSDNSNSGYAVLALEYAENPFYEFNIEIPDSLRTHLDVWISTIQAADGSSLYMPGYPWPNILKAGNLIQQMNFAGYPVTDPRVELTLGYIVDHFNDMDSGIYAEGWYYNIQAAFTLMKGLESYGIEILDPEGSAIDWFDEVSDRLIDLQYPAGYWTNDPWTGDPDITTAWALLTLQKVSPPLTVMIDIKPGSDPNGLNLKNNGVVPVAILATDDFDPASVDPITVEFEGATPLRWVSEDVDFDGDMDLLFHFNTQETDIVPGDPDATLTGQTLSGKSFSGVDTIKTVPKE